MATPQQQAETQQKPAGSKPAPRIRDVVFHDAVGPNGGAFTASLGEKDVAAIVPGCIDSTGRLAFADDKGERPSDGLLVTWRLRGGAGKSLLSTRLVPWSNIKDIVFDDVEVPAPTPAPAA